jgi:maltose O-acetyltransferase
MSFKFFLKAAFGNIATLFGFFSPLAKLLHSIRGVRFKDRKSVFLSVNVLIDNRFPENIYIGRDVWLTNGVKIICHSQTSLMQQETLSLRETIAPVIIKDGAFIGVGAIILPGVTIGQCSRIGAGSVVTHDIPDNCFAAGNPAKVIRSLI